ncbi:uncharacterized protein BDR25DRAFT_339141 [Lindgomyces ingoldianus]|uniref:Uncharacterized protein n=1 Tax=Lindgomyces ingoldianus TaxID=673940 RepID=A0ACB6RCX4_9PLEO|nr:uncharacterized protein BDR25DRAFT_339141 [Lindgomyces ingoldianus]KAF2477114.1 hypothetical protein BDR25DRAFT_339141 [Lindgomyces ingoldianus]
MMDGATNATNGATPAAANCLEEFFDFGEFEPFNNSDSTEGTTDPTPLQEAFPALGSASSIDWRDPSVDQHHLLATLPFHTVHETPNTSVRSDLTPDPFSDLKVPFWHSAVSPNDDFAFDLNQSWHQGAIPYDTGDPSEMSISPQHLHSFIPSKTEILPSKTRGLSSTKSARTNSEQPMSRKRRPRCRIPSGTKRALEFKFGYNPYPSTSEIEAIAKETQLEPKQVRNWYNNTRARKRGLDAANCTSGRPRDDKPCLTSKLSKESLEVLSRELGNEPQSASPSLKLYLESSYPEEAASLSDIEAALESGPPHRLEVLMDSSSGSRIGKSASVITSLTSSDGSAPTTYTLSSIGSNVSSFGRDRRRGRRRIPWRTSPYNKSKATGSHGRKSDTKTPFFCTFCPRAFRSKYEWVRHEDSVHALRTTWICCNSKQERLQFCPFCGCERPDDYHLALHRYQQCRNKPEQQRTFYRRDHFVQHLHHVHFPKAKHPSEQVGCQSRMTTNGENSFYGCKALAMTWRQFGHPIRPEDPMLHCGFCGTRLRDWKERCDHVANHFISGAVDRSVWWPERLATHLENLCVPQTVGPFRCRYCLKVFTNNEAMNKHSHCRVWSCRFLPSFNDLASESSAPPLCPHFPSPKAHHCHLCGAGHQSGHVEHATQYHKYRECEQEFYVFKEEFLHHLHTFHGAAQPPLLQHSPIIEQHFSRNKGGSFEAIVLEEILRDCRQTSQIPLFADPISNGASATPFPPAEPQYLPNVSPGRNKTSQRFSDFIDIPAKVRRQRSVNSPQSKPESQGPRFFRSDPFVPFLSMRVYYLRNARLCNLFADGSSVLEEVPQSHIASLVMSSGLVGLAGVRWPVGMKKDEKGLVEFGLEE